MRYSKATNILVAAASLVGTAMLGGVFSLSTPPGFAEEKKAALPESPIKVALVSDAKDIGPGKPFKLFVDFEMQPEWHIYYKEPGQTAHYQRALRHKR